MEVMILRRPISRLYCVWFHPLGTVSLFSGKDGTYGLDILEEFTTFELGIENNNISKWTELKNIYVASMIFSPIVLPLYKQPSVSGTELTQPSVKHHQVIFGTTYIVMRAEAKASNCLLQAPEFHGARLYHTTLWSWLQVQLWPSKFNQTCRDVILSGAMTRRSCCSESQAIRPQWHWHIHAVSQVRHTHACIVFTSVSVVMATSRSYSMKCQGIRSNQHNTHSGEVSPWCFSCTPGTDLELTCKSPAKLGMSNN